MLLCHPGKEENLWQFPCIWIHPSQTKIKYALPGITDSAKLCINMLCSSHMHMQVHLSKEAMINLTENGVPHSVFEQLLHELLDKVDLV